jgi:hypothetical protein
MHGKHYREGNYAENQEGEPSPTQQRQDKNQGKTDGLREWSVAAPP